MNGKLLHQAEHGHALGRIVGSLRLRGHLLLHFLHRLDEVERVAADIEGHAERAGIVDGDVVLRQLQLPSVGCQVPAIEKLPLIFW